MQRHPTISARTAENLGYLRRNITQEKIRCWFKDLEDFLLTEYSIVAKDFLKPENSNRVYNFDESGFALGGKSKLKVIAEKGSKSVYNTTTETKEQITVLACVSGAGVFQNPLVIFPGVRPIFQFKGVDPSKYSVAVTPNGWISSDAFFSWFSNIFIKNLRDTGITFPILVFMDGHSTHANLAIVEFCKRNDVILFCFPAHASHILQPLDVSVFGPLKQFWNDSLTNFRAKYSINMTRANFFPVFDEAFEKAKGRPANVVAGFRKCGIIPFDVDAIDFSRLINPVAAAKRFAVKEKVSAEQRLGSIRSFQKFCKELTEENLEMFQRRYMEGYDVKDDSDKNQLWRSYKVLRELSESVRIEELQGNTSQEDSTDDVVPDNELPPSDSTSNVDENQDLPVSQSIFQPPPDEEQMLLHSEATPNCDHSSSVPVAPLTSTPQRSVENDCVAGPSGLSNNHSGNSVSCENPKFYDSFVGGSPFKSYLKINDQLIITRKVTKRKPTMPPAVTGSAYQSFLLKKQEEKKAEEESKQKKKEERLAKKMARTQKTKVSKNLFGRSQQTDVQDLESSEDDEICLSEDKDGEDEDNVEEIFDLESCFACGGSEDKNRPAAWMGCNYCPRWYHRSCLSEGYTSLTSDEIKNLDFKCNECLKLQKLKEKRTRK